MIINIIVTLITIAAIITSPKRIKSYKYMSHASLVDMAVQFTIAMMIVAAILTVQIWIG